MEISVFSFKYGAVPSTVKKRNARAHIAKAKKRKREIIRIEKNPFANELYYIFSSHQND